MSAPLVVGVADCAVSDDSEQTLVTYALGSCVAVCIYDPVAGVGGLLHYLLPDSSIDAAKAVANPFMFADTGIPLLFRRTYAMGAEKRRLVVRTAGGAAVSSVNDSFQIGSRNILALRKIFWKAGVPVTGGALGGTDIRTVSLNLRTGEMRMRVTGNPEEQFLFAGCAETRMPPPSRIGSAEVTNAV